MDRFKLDFLMGKAKLAPQSDPTIPRLELCAAVLAVEMSELIHDELDLKVDSTTFYSNSKVVLGYINNANASTSTSIIEFSVFGNPRNLSNGTTCIRRTILPTMRRGQFLLHA